MVAVDIHKIPKIVYQRECDRVSPADCSGENLTTLQEKIFKQKIGNEQSVGEIDFISQQSIFPRREWRFVREHQPETIFVFHGELPEITPRATVLVDSILHEFESPFLPTILNRDLKALNFPHVEETQEEIEEAFSHGIQPLGYQHKILFSQEVELKTSELRRWRPNIIIDPLLLDDDE
jgi:hypothetical protein